MIIQLANLASAGDSPEDTEAVESYLAKKKERQPAKHTAGKWRMEERARRAEKGILIVHADSQTAAVTNCSFVVFSCLLF